MPVLYVLLEPIESVFSDCGELSWMTASIQMTTHTLLAGSLMATEFAEGIADAVYSGLQESRA